MSQFVPGTQPARWTFPQRNVVTSGLSVGTVVVEAGETSGAKLQAELCLEHGKRLFLLEHLVTHQRWAQELADTPGVSVVSSARDVLDQIVIELGMPSEIVLTSS